MLDYASRVSSWSIELMRESFTKYNEDLSHEEPYSTDEFWDHVGACLKAEKVKLVFAADEIPRSLKTLIEFMDRNMAGIEVYGVEIRRYITNGTTMLSSTVVGETPVSPSPSSYSNIVWNENSMNQYLTERYEERIIPIIKAIENAASEIGIDYSFSQHTKNPIIYFHPNDTYLFNISCWSKSGRSICTAEFWIRNLLSIPGMNLSEKDLRNLIGGIPKKEEAEKAGLLWNTPNYLHIELNAFSDGENLQYFIRSMRKLYEMLV